MAMVEDSRGLVLASHNTKLVRLYCNRAIWFDQGSIRMDGNVEEVIDAFELETTLPG